MAGDMITYNYDVIAEGVDLMQKCNREIGNLIDALVAETGHALDAWDGPAAESYNALSGQIAQSFGEMNTALNDLGKSILEQAEIMKQQDRNSGKQFA